MGISILGCEKIERREEIAEMEPEMHIERFGVDHYIKCVFIYETKKQQAARKRYLLSFECLRKKQELFLLMKT
jgi:hypothetical protein